MHASGGDTVAADIVLNVILGYGIGHGDDGTLAHRVREAVGQRRRACDGSHIENHASAVRFHVTDALVDAVVDPFYIDAKEPVEIVFVGAFHGSDMRDPGVVHQDVDTFLGEDLLKRLPDLPLICNVAGMDGGVPASIGDLFRGRLGLFRVDVRNSNRGAVGRETRGNGLPNAAAAARNDGYFAIQTEISDPAACAVQREIPRFQGIKSS